MDIKQRIFVLVGETIDDVALLHILNEASRRVISDLPPQALEPLKVEVTDPDGTTGVSLAEYRVLEVHKGGYYAVPISSSIVDTITTDPDEESPLFYISGTTGYVLPGGGTFVCVQYLTFTQDTMKKATITGYPLHILDVIVYRAALMVIDHIMAHKHKNMTLTITRPTVPTAPNAPVIYYSDATAVAPSATTIGALPSAPIFAAPSFGGSLSLPTFPTLDLSVVAIPTPPAAPSIAYSVATAASIAQTSIAALPTAPTYTPPTFGGSLSLPVISAINVTLDASGGALTVPDPPAALTLSYSDAAAASVSQTTISSLPDPPTFLPPAFEGSITAPVIADLDVDNDVSTSFPALPTLQDIVRVDAIAQTATAAAVGSLPTPPVYAPVLPTLDFTDWESAQAEWDPERMQAELVKVQVQLDEYQAQISEAQSKFQEEVEEYRAEVSKVVQTAQMEQEAAMLSAQNAQNAELANASEATAAQLSQAQVLLQQLQTQVSHYESELNARIAAYRINEIEKEIGLFAQAASLALQKYATDLSIAQSAFEAQNTEYQAEVQKRLQQAQLDQERLIDVARRTTDVDLQNKLQTTQIELQEYGLNLQRHSQEMANYEAEITRVLQKWESDYKRVLEAWSVEQRQYIDYYAAQLNASRDAFMASVEVYRAGVERNAQQAQLDQQRLTRVAELTTDTDLQNKAQTAQVALREYELSLQQHASDLAEAQATIDRNVTDFRENFLKAFEPWKVQQSLHLEKYGQDIAANQAQLQADITAYGRLVDKEFEKARISAQEAAQTAQQATEVALQNKAQQMQAQLQEYQSRLALHSEEISSFDAQIRTLIQAMTAEAEVMANKLRMLQYDKSRLAGQYEEVKLALMRYYNGYSRKQGVWMHEF